MVKLLVLAVTLLVQVFCVSSVANQTRVYGDLSYSSYGQVPSYGQAYGSPSSYQQPMDRRQPLYILTPQTNNFNAIDYNLKEYANAIEVSVSFDPRSGHVLFAGKLRDDCDCGIGCYEKVPIDQYLEHVKDLTKKGSPKYNPQLVMLYTVPKGFENSTDAVKEEAGRQMFLVINKHLYENGNPLVYIYLINGIPDPSWEPYVRGFESAKRELGLEQFYHKVQGWDVWLTSVPEPLIVSMWQRLGLFRGLASNLWQSNGRSICENTCEAPVHASDLAQALAAKKYIVEIKKVNFWTVVTPQDIMYLLDHGVDSVETSEPELVWKLINSPPYNQCYRLATWADSPWTQVNPLPACNKPLESYGSDYSTNYGIQGPSYGSPSQYQSSGNPSYASNVQPYSTGYADVSSYTGGY